MPADCSSFNQHNFETAQGHTLVPYPSAKEAFQWSNTHSPSDDFFSLGLSDFFIAHQQVAHCWLDQLALEANTHEHLSWSVSVGIECREPYNAILEAGIGYAGAATIVVMDKVAFVNKKQDKRMEGIKKELWVWWQGCHL